MVDTRDRWRVADRALNAALGWEFGAVDAADANLTRGDTVLASRRWSSNVILGGNKDLNVATDEAVKRVEVLRVGLCCKKDAIAGTGFVVPRSDYCWWYPGVWLNIWKSNTGNGGRSWSNTDRRLSEAKPMRYIMESCHWRMVDRDA